MEEKHYFVCADSFPVKAVEPNVVKINEHYFTGVYPSPVLMNLDARKCIIYCHVCLSKLKDEVVFSCFSDFHC